MVGLVELQIANAKQVRFAVLRLQRLRTPLQCPQARQEFFNRKGFDEVVVNAGIERFHLVFDFVVAGEHQDRHGHSVADSAADV